MYVYVPSYNFERESRFFFSFFCFMNMRERVRGRKRERERWLIKQALRCALLCGTKGQKKERNKLKRKGTGFTKLTN